MAAAQADAVKIIDPRHALSGRSYVLVEIKHGADGSRECVIWDAESKCTRQVDYESTNLASGPLVISASRLTAQLVSRLIERWSQNEEGLRRKLQTGSSLKTMLIKEKCWADSLS